MTRPDEDLSDLVSGDDAADRIYRRLMARRRRLLGRTLVLDEKPATAQGAAHDAGQQSGEAAGDNRAKGSGPGGHREKTRPGEPGQAAPPIRPAAPARPQRSEPSGPASTTGSREPPLASSDSDEAAPPASFDFQRWQPRSQTMRFIKDHPGLTVAIGVPALVLLSRKGNAGRLLRFVASPTGLMTIRQASRLASSLGLLDKPRS